MTSKNLFQICFGPDRQFTIRLYADYTKTRPVRIRHLDGGHLKWKRFSVDVWRLGFLFENYGRGKISTGDDHLI